MAVSLNSHSLLYLLGSLWPMERRCRVGESMCVSSQSSGSMGRSFLRRSWTDHFALGVPFVLVSGLWRVELYDLQGALIWSAGKTTFLCKLFKEKLGFVNDSRRRYCSIVPYCEQQCLCLQLSFIPKAESGKFNHLMYLGQVAAMEKHHTNTRH